MWSSGGEVAVDDGQNIAGHQFRLASECRGEGGVGGVAPGGDPRQRGSGGEPRWVEDLPTGPPARLHDGVEIHRRQARGIDGNEPCGHAEGPAQRDGHVGEVAARTSTGQEGIDRCVPRIARTGLILEALEHPGRHLTGEVRSPLEPGQFRGREASHGVGWAVPALAQGRDRFSVDDCLVGTGRWRCLLRTDRGPVGDGEPAGLGADHVHAATPISGQL